MRITDEWLEVTLSTVETYTTIQNTSGEVILVALADDIPNAEETKNARRVNFFEDGKKNEDEMTYNHSINTKKMYVRLTKTKVGYISVY